MRQRQLPRQRGRSRRLGGAGEPARYVVHGQPVDLRDPAHVRGRGAALPALPAGDLGRRYADSGGHIFQGVPARLSSGAERAGRTGGR